MATKIAPKKAVKTAQAKPDTKAAAAAERAKVIESVVPALAEKVEAIKEREEGVKTSLLDLVDTAKELRDENDLSKDELSIAIRTAYAEIYNLKLEDVKSGGKGFTQYTNASKIVRFVFPANEKVLASDRAKGYGFNDLYATATSGESATKRGKKPSQGRGGDTKAKSDKKNAFESIEDFKNAAAGLISNGMKSGFELDTMDEAWADLVAEYTNKKDADEKE